MSRERNPEPEPRGALLPAGCKDLLDALHFKQKEARHQPAVDEFDRILERNRAELERLMHPLAGFPLLYVFQILKERLRRVPCSYCGERAIGPAIRSSQETCVPSATCFWCAPCQKAWNDFAAMPENQRPEDSATEDSSLLLTEPFQREDAYMSVRVRLRRSEAQKAASRGIIAAWVDWIALDQPIPEALLNLSHAFLRALHDWSDVHFAVCLFVMRGLHTKQKISVKDLQEISERLALAYGPDDELVKTLSAILETKNRPGPGSL